MVISINDYCKDKTDEQIPWQTNITGVTLSTTSKFPTKHKCDGPNVTGLFRILLNVYDGAFCENSYLKK